MPEAISIVLLLISAAVLTVAWRRQVHRTAVVEAEHAAYGEEEHRMLDFLHQLGEALYQDPSARRMHMRIVNGVSDVVQARGGALYLFDPVKNKLVPSAISKDCPPLIELPESLLNSVRTNPKAVRSHFELQTQAVDAGFLGECFQSQQPVSIPDLRQHIMFAALPAAPGKSFAVMVAPLNHGPKRLGVLVVARPEAAKSFTRHDFDVFVSIAEQSAFALGSARVQQEALEKRRYEDEFRSAAEIQRILLPSAPPVVPGYALAAAYQPAKIVSGDYYDFLEIDAENLGFVIADVSGKGVPASLVMATCRSLIRVSAQGVTSPAEVLRRVNRLIFGDIREDMFVSLAYAVLHRASGRVTMARAGHDAPFLFRSATGGIERLKPPGLAIGVDGGNVFDRVTKDFVFQLDPGDCLLFFTDGVSEALNKAGDEYTEERMQQTMSSAMSTGAPGLVNALMADVKTFMGTTRQNDDITLIAVERDAAA